MTPRTITLSYFASSLSHPGGAALTSGLPRQSTFASPSHANCRTAFQRPLHRDGQCNYNDHLAIATLLVQVDNRLATCRVDTVTIWGLWDPPSENLLGFTNPLESRNKTDKIIAKWHQGRLFASFWIFILFRREKDLITVWWIRGRIEKY